MSYPTTDPVPANLRAYNPGGLMRCCIETLRVSDTMTTLHQIMDCKHCNSAMIVGEDGNWKWLHP